MFNLKKKNKRIGIPKCITHNVIRWNIEDLAKTKRFKVTHNEREQKITIDSTLYRFIPIALGVSFILIEVWSYSRADEITWNFGRIFTTIIGFGIGGFSLVYGLVAPKRIFVFDRLNGTITYPEVKWNSSNTVSFKDSEWIIKLHMSGRFYGGMSLGIVQNNGWSAASLIDGDFYDFWSFIVWYMDRNRPLPPGNVFDPHRKMDYEHRKAAGFPKPLYEASIPIPTK